MRLFELGFDAGFQQEFASLAAQHCQPARVARQDRDSYVLYGDGRAFRAQLPGVVRHRATSPLDFPAVGDWVAVERPFAGVGVIRAVLPRRSAITRRAAGTGGGVQLLVSNVDSLLICCGLDNDYNPRRIERYLSLAYGCGVSPIVVLTKADVCSDAAARQEEVELAAVGAPVLALSGLRGDNVEALRALVPPGSTAALVGSSGVGKSTLVNRLLGRELLETRAVRAGDGRGRHTTTFRQLLPLPGGGVLIDTPGLRELQLAHGAADVEASFADLAQIAVGCRFRDCSHDSEPGCAVQAAIRAGDFPGARLESFRKQQREMAYADRKDDPAAVAAHKAKWKAIHKSAQRWIREKYRG